MVSLDNIFSASDISCAALLEEHIFNDYIEGKKNTSKDKVLEQFKEFDPWGAAEILLHNWRSNTYEEELKEFYLDCITFTNWHLDTKPQEVNEELEMVKKNYTGFLFLLNVLKTRLLFSDFDEMGLKTKRYVISILNPGTINSDIVRKKLYNDDIDELAEKLESF